MIFKGKHCALAMTLVFVMLSGCKYEPELPPDVSVWDYADPSSVGMNEGQLFLLDNTIKSGNMGIINSVIIIKDDKMIYESYYNTFHSRGTQQTLNALTVSLTSMMVGVALESGAIGSIDDPIQQYLPEYQEVFVLDPGKADITINDVVSMRTGIAWNENITAFSDPANNAFQMSQSADWTRYILEQQRDSPPGLRFAFNSGTAVVIAKILENATGVPLEDYMQTFLFNPLGIQSAQWTFTSDGLPNTAWGLTLNPIDITKLGYLYQKNGNWFGEQVVPASWVQLSTDLQFQISSFSDYGRHWWRYSQFNSIQNVLQENDIYYANGFGGQYLYVVPHLNMVVTITAENFSNGLGFAGFVMMRDLILPAVQ